MEKQEYSQLELFNRTGDEETPAQRLSGTFLSYIRTYERLVLMLIGIVITGVVCFCVGVEKGKHIALSCINSNLDIAYRQRAVPAQKSAAEAPARAGDTAPVPAAPAAAPANAVPQNALQRAIPVPAPVRATEPVAVAQAVAAEAGGYTIQVATYNGQTSAQREMDVLKKQGMLPVIRSSGKYTVLCVGNFPDKATAKSLLTQLKKKYRDCYIRRL